MDEDGRRCIETERLEFHHHKPYGRGGDHSPENIRVLCRTHNRYLAELDYGKEAMEQYRRLPSRVFEPAAVYTFSQPPNRIRSFRQPGHTKRLIPWESASSWKNQHR